MASDRVDGVVVTRTGCSLRRAEIADGSSRSTAASCILRVRRAGALASYGLSNLSIFRRTGYYVDKILKGTPPATLPVEQPTRFEFIINLEGGKKRLWRRDCDVGARPCRRGDGMRG